MPTTSAYFNRYENLSFTRGEDGVPVVRFRTDGGPITFTGRTHEDLPAALEDIALDVGNKALVITGTGDTFMDRIDGPGPGEIFRPAQWEKIRTEGSKVLQRLLELPMPVIGVANGPATVHSEYLPPADIHIASDWATYGDLPHPAFGITGGDGPHAVWEETIGSARTKAADPERLAPSAGRQHQPDRDRGRTAPPDRPAGPGLGPPLTVHTIPDPSMSASPMRGTPP